MKLNITVDCTPAEARQFLGLPDVTALQDEIMQILRDKALENMRLMEPEQAMKAWLPMMNQGMANGMDLFKSMMSNAATAAASPGERRKSEK